MTGHRKIPGISYTDHVTNEEVRTKTAEAIGPHKDILTIVRTRKMTWSGHSTRCSGPAKPSYKAQHKEEESEKAKRSDKKTPFFSVLLSFY